MATGYHVNGVAEARVGTGSAGATELLGHSVDGFDIDPEIIQIPVYDDAGGGPGGVPSTFSHIGEIHRITGNLIVYDEAVLAKVRKQSQLMATEGLMIAAGKLLDAMVQGGGGGTVGGLFRLLILSPDEAVPWNYITARLLGKGTKLCTHPLVYRLAFEAIPFKGSANTLAGVTLYNRTTSG
jgi:hypothetical protein